jgi:hypothetical protein
MGYFLVHGYIFYFNLLLPFPFVPLIPKGDAEKREVGDAVAILLKINEKVIEKDF